MSKTDPHVRELLRKNQYAEALRYYRTRYNAERPEAMRVLQEIQAELSGKPPEKTTPPVSGLVTASGDPLRPAQPITQAPPSTGSGQRPTPPQASQSVPQEAAKPSPLPASTPAPVVIPQPVLYQSPPKADPGAIRSDSHWNNLSPSLRHELQGLLEDNEVLDAIRRYWRESQVELRDAKERVLRWASSFPPKR